jgi:aminoglycoside phosphotransferase (APT) family kinase protein
MLEREAAVMAEIGAVVPEVPRLLGLEESDDARLLRMPYSLGCCLGIGDVDPVRNLLETWTSGEPARALQTFPEWQAISTGLARHSGHEAVLERLSGIRLRPSIRHGDFARWNLLRTHEGDLKVLDWEWGERHGMPGLDLVHYLAQDFRLVSRLPAAQVIAETIKALESPYWSPLLESVGWANHAKDLVNACLAFKQGAGHQENEEILRAALATTL